MKLSPASDGALHQEDSGVSSPMSLTRRRLGVSLAALAAAVSQARPAAAQARPLYKDPRAPVDARRLADPAVPLEDLAGAVAAGSREGRLR